jgi:hypothetical protein
MSQADTCQSLKALVPYEERLTKTPGKRQKEAECMQPGNTDQPVPTNLLNKANVSPLGTSTSSTTTFRTAAPATLIA